jgi:hypothetical protein
MFLSIALPHQTNARKAGWLIALMVWLLRGADFSRVSITIILTYMIRLRRFNQTIAGSVKMQGFFLLA